MQTSAQIHQLLHNTHQQQMDDSMVSALSLPFDASTPSSSGQPPLFSPNSSDACTGGSRAAQSSTTEGSEKLLANSFLLDQNDEKPSQMADEHRLGEFVVRMELVLHEAVSQSHLVLGNPQDSISSPQLHILLGLYATHLRDLDSAERQFSAALK
uniref:GRAS domain-containing protein n=1 Tax=Globodera pallida TaxID=36090 RepID=A0A183CS43_GLOPA